MSDIISRPAPHESWAIYAQAISRDHEMFQHMRGAHCRTGQGNWICAAKRGEGHGLNHTLRGFFVNRKDHWIVRAVGILVILGSLAGCAVVRDTASAAGNLVSAGVSIIP